MLQTIFLTIFAIGMYRGFVTIHYQTAPKLGMRLKVKNHITQAIAYDLVFVNVNQFSSI